MRTEILSDQQAEEQLVTLALQDPKITLAAGFNPLLVSDQRLRGVLSSVIALQQAGEEPTALAIGIQSGDPELGVLVEKMGTRQITPNSQEFVTRRLRDLALRRRGVKLCDRYYKALHEDLETPADEIIGTLEAKVLGIRSVKSANMRKIGEITMDVLSELEWKAENPGVIRGLSTGFRGLDVHLDGLCPGGFTVVAARPSVGKSSLLGNILIEQALQGVPSCIHSLETKGVKFGSRLTSQVSRVSLLTSLKRAYTQPEVQRMMAAIQTIAGWPLWIDDTPGLTFDRWRSEVRRMVLQHGIKIACVDQLNLMKGDRQKDKVGQICDITSGMKIIAEELGIHVILLAQLRRSNNQRWDRDKKAMEGDPRIDELKGSGSIEEDADNVILIGRDQETNAEFGDFIIGKARDGKIGRVPFTFDPTCYFFAEDTEISS